MKNTLFIISFFIFPLILVSQITIDENTSKKLENSNNYVEQDFDENFDEEEIENYIKDKKLKLRMEVGTMFGTTFGSGDYFGTYISPHLSYRLSPKFSLSVGARINNYYGSLFNEPLYSSIYGYPSSNFTRSFIYVEGAYKLNDRLRVTGAVYKEFNIFHEPSPMPYGNDYDYEGIIMGVDYKIGENAFIRGQIEISNGRNPYSRYPFSDPFNNASPNPFDSRRNPF